MLFVCPLCAEILVIFMPKYCHDARSQNLCPKSPIRIKKPFNHSNSQLLSPLKDIQPWNLIMQLLPTFCFSMTPNFYQHMYNTLYRNFYPSWKLCRQHLYMLPHSAVHDTCTEYLVLQLPSNPLKLCKLRLDIQPSSMHKLTHNIYNRC